MSDTIAPEELEQHQLWNLTGGAGGKRLARAFADLTGADLTGAHLRGADGENLKLVGPSPVITLGFGHGWPLMLLNTDKGIRVVCGCRGPWEVKKAQAHWKKHDDSQRQKVVLPALEALLAIAKAHGWKENGK